MELVVVGAGVGQTGTHSLKVALEQLLDAPCRHMLEILDDPTKIPAWTDAIEARRLLTLLRHVLMCNLDVRQGDAHLTRSGGPSPSMP